MNDYSLPGSNLPNGAVVITTKGSRVLAVLPGNKVTPWVSWRLFNPADGDCTNGTYYYTWAEAVADGWAI